ncbi:MAG: hypothetical protein ACETV0_08560 [Nitrososphaeria archaeon]
MIEKKLVSDPRSWAKARILAFFRDMSGVESKDLPAAFYEKRTATASIDPQGSGIEAYVDFAEHCYSLGETKSRKFNRILRRYAGLSESLYRREIDEIVSELQSIEERLARLGYQRQAEEVGTIESELMSKSEEEKDRPT